MDISLSEQQCQVCQLSSRPLSSDDVSNLLATIPRWKKVQREGIDHIQRDFHFRDFRAAFEFAEHIAVLAEQQDHHPSLLIEWGHVTVAWTTHKINGLHLNDFIMAAKTDLLLTSSG